MNKKTKKIIQNSIGIIITILLVWYLISLVDIESIWTTLLSVSLLSIILVTIIYCLTFLLRAAQLKFVFKKKFTLKELFNISAVHNMFNMILPARIGELSYIYYFRKKGIKGSESLSTLLVIRILDVIAIIGLLFISLLFVTNLPEIITGFIYYALAVLVIGLAILFLMLTYSKQTVKFMQRIAKSLKIHRKKITKYIFLKMTEASDSFTYMRQKNKLGSLFIMSVVIWFLKYLVYIIIIDNIGLTIGFWSIILAATFVAATSMLPIYSVGGFGTVEGVLAIVFIALGIAKAPAIVAAFTIHIIQFVNYIIYGVLGLGLMKTEKKSKKT